MYAECDAGCSALDKQGSTVSYLQNVLHRSTRKGPYSCSPHRPSLAALQALPSRIPGAVEGKTVMKKLLIEIKWK